MIGEFLLSLVTSIWSVLKHWPTLDAVVITLVVFTALLWLNIGVVNLWNRIKPEVKKEERE
ncbi:hypothetical protein LCGC14_0627770 [marine sediment metagenome]|uniref:Uncharacterized protein n=1 Tax=marine sediment metagenome TaxID=412755 RepID=A0A0F9RM97_9ZZZZ